MRIRPGGVFLAFLVLAAVVYLPGLSGGWFFDDYSSIVHNQGVQPDRISISSLSRAAWSSPSSLFKRPLASITFALNYLADGLNPFGWKLVNVIIHLLNGLVLFFLIRALILSTPGNPRAPPKGQAPDNTAYTRAGLLAALIAGAWMLLPINLTAVLYVVQRMASLANLFVLIGLWGYVASRRRMLAGRRGLIGCIASLLLPTAIGFTAKETAVMLPLYAFLIEWIIFGFRKGADGVSPAATHPLGASSGGRQSGLDYRIAATFCILLLIPLALGLAWLLPHALDPQTWANRDFTLRTRLLSEARIVVDYIGWIFIPLPQWLSFYHDNFTISQGLLHPVTTLLSLLAIVFLLVLAWTLRKRRPLVALGIFLFFGSQLLTATILPLELIFEHRNYFASIGLMLAVLPLLARPGLLPLARRALLVLLFLGWAGMTAFTAYSWGNPVRLAAALATRNPQSSRAQYKLGATLIRLSNYDPDSPYTNAAYAPLERAMAMPDSSILPEQALLYLNAHLHRPIKKAWWDSLIRKLKAHKPGPQNISALQSLASCVHSGDCRFQESRMIQAFLAALSHPDPSANLLAVYGDYAWNTLGDDNLGLRMATQAAKKAPNVAAYHITLAHMYLVLRAPHKTEQQITALERLNYAGRLDQDIAKLSTSLQALNKAIKSGLIPVPQASQSKSTSLESGASSE